MATKELLRALPSVDKILSAAGCQQLVDLHGHTRAIQEIRHVLDETRASILAGTLKKSTTVNELIELVKSRLQAIDENSFISVLNLTGTVLHTNLGIANLPEEAVKAVNQIAKGASNLEFDIEQGKRGGWKPGFIFEGDEEREEESKNLSDDQLLIEITLPDNKSANVYQTESAYICPDMAPDKHKGGTRIAKTILKKEIPEDQAAKLFAEGKTEVIDGFISKKGRPFKAHLLLDKSTGKLGWEFPPRAKKKTAKKKVALLNSSCS